MSSEDLGAERVYKVNREGGGKLSDMGVELNPEQVVKDGQVTLVFFGDRASDRALELTNQLRKCFAQKAPWKNIRCDLAESVDEIMWDLENEKVPTLDVYKNYDYVEWVIVDDTRSSVCWGQGDFVVGCSFDDCIIEEIQLHYASDEVDSIWVGVRPGGLLMHDDYFNGVRLFTVGEDGYVGHYEIETKDEKGNTTWKQVNTSKVLLHILVDRQMDKLLEEDALK